MATLLAIGTAKGLFLATSADDRRSWEVTGPHFPMTGVYAVGDRHARRARPGCWPASTARTSGRASPSATTSAPPGTSPSRRRSRSRRTPAPRSAGSGSSRPAGRPAGRGLGRHRAVGAVPLRPTAGAATSWSARLWDHPHRPEWGAGFGGQAVHTILPHPDDPRPDAGGDVDRRRLPHRRRRRDAGRRPTPASRPTSCPTRGPSSASACTRSPATPADPERLYAQNHHGVYRSDDGGAHLDVDRRRPAQRLRLPDGGAPAPRPARSATSRWWPTASASRPTTAAGCSAPTTRARPGSRSRRACPTGRSTRRCCATRCAPTTRDPVGVYFGTRSGEVFASRDEGDTWAPGRRAPARRALRPGRGRCEMVTVLVPGRAARPRPAAPRALERRRRRDARRGPRRDGRRAGPGWTAGSATSAASCAGTSTSTWTGRTVGTPGAWRRRWPPAPRSRCCPRWPAADRPVHRTWSG